MQSIDNNTSNNEILIKDLFNTAYNFYKNEDYNKAIELLNKCIEINPLYDEALYLCGLAYYNKKDFNNAIIYYQKAIEINPDNDKYFASLGIVYYYLKDYQKAKDCYDQAIKINPKIDYYYYNLALVYFYQKKYQEAIDNFSISIEMDKFYVDSYYNRAYAYYELGKYEKVIEDYINALLIDPLNSQTYYKLGIIYTKMHKFEEAMIQFDLAMNKSYFDYSFKTDSQCIYESNYLIDSEYCLIPTLSMMQNFDDYLEKGYMRYANYFRLKTCEECSDCKPLRIEVDKFKMSKSQKRVFKKNNDIIILKILDKPVINEEKFNLFKKYQYTKHKKSNNYDIENDFASRHFGFYNTKEFDFYYNDKLIGVSLVDFGKYSLYSSFFYYDTDFLKNSIGIFSILKEIEYAKSKGYKYYYLGWFVEKSSNMAYKKRFGPNEILEKDKWIPFC